jgi:gluconokinase
MSAEKCCFLVMGVTASGKSTVGSLLAKEIGACFIEADELHSEKNLIKMSSGQPLTDLDRHDWLLKIKAKVDQKFGSENIVIACSALKQKYRDLLGAERYQLVYLKINKSTARKRVNGRSGHFMPASLINSQFAILEEPANALTFDHATKPDEIVKKILGNRC